MPRAGKDPTPQGRIPGDGRRETPPLDDTPELADTEAEKWAHSRPGPAATRDGAYFYGRKREREEEA